MDCAWVLSKKKENGLRSQCTNINLMLLCSGYQYLKISSLNQVHVFRYAVYEVHCTHLILKGVNSALGIYYADHLVQFAMVL